MGTDALFENHSIKEIQEIEKKLRNDIEHKKEELRQMVGERYRDLMEAADTITEMKEIAESVTGCIKSIEHSCTQLKKSSFQDGILSAVEEKVSKKRIANEFLYTVASQIKILMDSPTKIWSFIENKDFVSAISLYLLARHIHTLLLLDPLYRDKNVVGLFPIVKRQWTSINHFKHLLSQNSQSILKMQNSEPEDVIGPLCCNCLLSNVSLDEVALDILKIRKDVIRSIFSPEKSAKSQICEFVTVVQTTLKVVYVALYPENQSEVFKGYKTSLLYKTLQKLLSKDELGPVSLLDVNSSAVFKYLPSAITDFRPLLNTPLKECASDFLQTHCSQWLKDLEDCFHTEMKNLLNFVNSVQSLALIREAVFEKLTEIEHWDEICKSVLNQEFSIWDAFLKDCFWQRIQNIIDEQVKSASEFYEKDVEEALHQIPLCTKNSPLQLETNISLYVWMESPSDVMDNIAWQPRHHRNYWNSGDLSLKAMGFTPKIQSICKALDERLQNILQDVSHFSTLQTQPHPPEPHPPEKERLQHLLQLSAQLSNDGNDVYKYLAQAVERHLFNLSSFLETTLLYLEKEETSLENNCRVVILGRLCFGLANLCPHINVTLSSEKLSEYISRSLRHGSKIAFPSFKETDVWKDLKQKFLELSSSSFRVWSTYEIANLLSKLESEFVTSAPEGLLKLLLQWDKIEIQEESEQGNAVKSVLRIPLHISTPVSNALYKFCCKLNAVGGFAINSEVRLSMSKELLTGLLGIYKEKMDSSAADFNPRMTQILSLQLLFDVQFLTGLLVHKTLTTEYISSTSQEIINKAISDIDPFDMDVFAVPLQQNIKKALQKSLSLFGLLTSPDQASYLNSGKSLAFSSQMDHNILLASNTGSRFPLLPLSSKSNVHPSTPEKFLAPSKDSEPKSLPSHNSSPNLRASDISNNPMKSPSTASFYDRFTTMGSSWFGN